MDHTLQKKSPGWLSKLDITLCPTVRNTMLAKYKSNQTSNLSTSIPHSASNQCFSLRSFQMITTDQWSPDKKILQLRTIKLDFKLKKVQMYQEKNGSVGLPSLVFQLLMLPLAQQVMSWPTLKPRSTLDKTEMEPAQPSLLLCNPSTDQTPLW